MKSSNNSKKMDTTGLFSFDTPFDFNGIQASHDQAADITITAAKNHHLFGIQLEIGDDDDHHPDNDHVFQKSNVTNMSDDHQGKKQQQSGRGGGTKFNFPADEFIHFRENMKPVKEMQSSNSFQFSSLELLSNYGSGFKKLKSDNKYGNDGDHHGINYERGRRKLSTEDIIRVTGARYVQFSDMRYDDFSMVMHPFGHALSGLSDEETKDVELVHLLLTAAEKVGYEQFERASRLLSRCEWIAAERGNPVQRIVYYFAEALRERIDKETGRLMIPKGFDTNKLMTGVDNGLNTNLVTVRSHQYIPFSQAMQFMAIQAIVENVETATKIHIIDLQIRSGVQWTGLMQALAEREHRRVERLKITAVGLIANRPNIEECGKRLESFAASLKLPFSFHPLYVEDLGDIKEELFKIGSDEALAVFCPMVLRSMISRPSSLENLMRVMKNLNPAIFVVIEIEANHNSPSFVNRFIEALFFYSAYFDCIDTCMEGDAELRAEFESVLWSGIRNIIAMEGEDRVVRNVKMEVWSAFFSRFRMVEVGFSESSWYQANLVIKQFPCGRCCTLDKMGKSVIVGWKGTPIHSVSAWKFTRERGRVFGNYRF